MIGEKNLSKDAKIGIGERFAYGLGGAFGTGAINIFIASFLLIFYAEIMGVNPLLASSVIGISKFLDGLSDLVAGRIIDNTHSKLGKTRIWILRMIPITIVSLYAIYLMPTGMSKIAQGIYMFITYNLASTVCYTMTYVAYMALNGLMTTDQASRGGNAGIQMIGNVLVGLIGNATIITLLTSFSSNDAQSAYGDRKGWLITLSIYMVIYAISELVVVFFTRERVIENAKSAQINNESKKTEDNNVPFMKTIKALVTNKYWIIDIIVCFVINFLMGLETSISSLVCTYILGDVSFYQVSATFNAVAMLVGMLIGITLMGKFSKRILVITGLSIRMLGNVVIIVKLVKFTVVFGGAMTGFGYGIAGAAFASIIQDVLTYGEWKNGFSMIGMGNAANSFCNKVGNSVGTILMGAIMSATGYVAGQTVQPESAIWGFKAIYMYIPFIFALVAIAAMAFYNLDKIYPGIVEDLKAGKYYSDTEKA
ncbi:MAG: MFS transporter [Pseudobutyrivibrio sp.]|nr:MFS transporter [Pseudobutyrivibrio sp.]